MLLPMVSDAEEIEIDGICYNLISKERKAEVITRDEKYSGNIVIPDKFTHNDVIYEVKTIKQGAFQNCNKLQTVIIPETVTSIETYAFFGCEKLSEIIIPNNVESIGTYAFNGCTKLSSLVLSEKLMKLESGTFANCYNLNNVVIPNSITSISSSVFYECSKLSNITLSENLRVIGGRAFDGCGMSSITIPASVVKIGCAAFENCTKLSSIYISDLTSWCNINFDCLDSFKRINYYTNPLYLAHHLYLNGEEITELTIPSYISKINDCAFIGGYGFDNTS